MIWNVCLKVYFKVYSISLFESQQGIIGFFQKLVKHDPCAGANLLEVLEDINFGCRVCISFHVGMFIIFDSAPDSIKKSVSRSVD